MKGKFELSVTFECEHENDLGKLAGMLSSIINDDMLVEQLTSKGAKSVRAIYGTLDLTDSLGDKVFGNFNPTGDEFVEEIKEKCARVYDMIEAIPVNGRQSAMFKTASQTSLLHAQMDAVKVKFLPKDI